MQHRLIQVELDLNLRSSCPALSDKVKEGGVARSIDQCILHGAPVQHQRGVGGVASETNTAPVSCLRHVVLLMIKLM